MKFGIITPVFDGCIGSLELLFGDIQSQTHEDWVWILCSNGYSKKMEQFVQLKNRALNSRNTNTITRFLGRLRPKIAYLHTDHVELPDPPSLLANIGLRRDLCIKRIKADYIFMIDADAKLLDKDMFRLINDELKKTGKELCIYRVVHEVGLLPFFPIGYGRIDMLNFCVKASLAKKIGYPTTVNPEAYGNDYWYFKSVYDSTNEDFVFIDRIFGQHNGNNSYKNLLKILYE